MATVHFGRLSGPAGFARPVAIKRLHAQLAQEPDSANLLLDEARLAARISHPNVVRTLDVVAEAGEVFVVMEYVHGATLAELVLASRRRGERIEPRIAVGVVAAMLQGLHAAHEARDAMGERLNLVHRDVSPHNALLGPDGVPRLLDFGIAKAAGRLQTTGAGQLKGKLAYMSPEQARGEALTQRTDIFSASIVLWELLAGRRLFYAENEAEVIGRVLTHGIVAPSTLQSDVPAALDRVVLKGLERVPANRYATAREMAVDLLGCASAASATEIGDWVERTCADELRERARRVAAIELAAVEELRLSRDRERRSLHSLTPEAFSLPTLGTRSRAWGRGMLAVIGVAISVLATAGYASSQAGQGSVASGRASAPVLNGPAPEAPRSPSTNSVANVATASSGDVAAPAPPAMTPAATPRLVPARRASSPGPIPARAADATSCDTPYTTDARGHVHFKPNCL
jgi:serine/threonine-protein kinase